MSAGGHDLLDLESAGQLGSPVLPSDMEMLQVKPLRPFAAGEICAFKEALTPAQAAAAAAHAHAGTAEGELRALAMHSPWKYALRSWSYNHHGEMLRAPLIPQSKAEGGMRIAGVKGIAQVTLCCR